jgi:hypothetical protein
MGLVESLFFYFIIGLVQDLLITIQAIALIEKRPVLSGILAVINTTLAATIWHYLLPSQALSFWVNGISYALGGGIGVGVTIWYKKRKPYVKQLQSEERS